MKITFLAFGSFQSRFNRLTRVNRSDVPFVLRARVGIAVWVRFLCGLCCGAGDYLRRQWLSLEIHLRRDCAHWTAAQTTDGHARPTT